MMKRIMPLSEISVGNYFKKKSKRYMMLEKKRSVNLKSSNRRRLNAEPEKRRRTILILGVDGIMLLLMKTHMLVN